ncbi:MAG: hypothetical protein A3K90_00990 [Pelodictyon luteolum]|uniref:Uncharacterized protein n=1 Tax=Pelodictyon luteolum TaxID=1100 RepID=A0A165L996_PELLU|nr:hypothetical protein [Pelodictyon luteolum]KZK73731.1 MAG: hypothetical protein A3K90_00990 [Pelodictyon luteolum]
MEQQNSTKKILDPIERAKLGVKVLSLPYSEAERVIDEYVSEGDYDKASVDFFKDQVETQSRIVEKGSELLSTGSEILRVVAGAVVKNWPKPPADQAASRF